jgi:hypothetical protein
LSMRRFLIRNAAGEQVGEGVEWSDGRTETRGLYGHRAVDGYFAMGVESAERGLASARLSIAWLDPEPADRSRDGDGGVIGFKKTYIDHGSMRLGDPVPAFPGWIDGDPAILEGVEGHIESTERGWRFVPKVKS